MRLLCRVGLHRWVRTLTVVSATRTFWHCRDCSKAKTVELH